MTQPVDVLARVRAALGRHAPLSAPPIPPEMDEPITRLVHSDFGLPELFARKAMENKIGVELVYVDELAERLIAFLRVQQVQRIALPVSPFLDKLGIPAAIADGGFFATRWDQMTLDALYDYDAAVTDVYAAVAETGSLVVRASPGHGRALSLVPPIHIAILQPKDFVPDLVDLLQKLRDDGVTSATSIITGPSKTSDIEMNLVVGVHGPTTVHAFVLQ
ncbi:MAG TPA: LUD domain-containing protein [Tepidisphaeraceae bacterium]|nr:LUD domain-containing protein [Tepidisphaeraceae bacterium]